MLRLLQGVSCCVMGVVHNSFSLTILFMVFAGIFLEVCAPNGSPALCASRELLG